MKIAVVYRSTARSVDGILDHSHLLTAALADAGTDCCFVDLGRRNPRLVQRRLSEADWVVLQYAPFVYGRWGFAPWLVVRFAAVRRRARRCLIIHEPYVANTTGHRRLMTLWQRLQLRMLERLADQVVTASAAWKPMLASRDVTLLPVGSNIPDGRSLREDARAQLNAGDETLVVASFGTGHDSTSYDTLLAAIASIGLARKDVLFLQLGSGSKLPSPAGVRHTHPGRLEAAELSKLMSAADLFLAPFVDGVTDRRTTVAAAAQHGIAVVGTLAPGEVAADWHARGMSLTPPDEGAAFIAAATALAVDDMAREQAAGRSRAYFEAQRSWHNIARDLIAVLR